MTHLEDTTRELLIHGCGGGLVTLVDSDVYEWAIESRWFASRYHGSAVYVQRRIRSEANNAWTTQRLHRVITSARSRQQVDHINRDTLDNRRANLRLVTNQQNQWNRGMDRRNTSGFKGVYFNKSASKWQAYINVNRKAKYLGVFATALEAALAYDAAAIRFFGEFARTNF